MEYILGLGLLTIWVVCCFIAVYNKSEYDELYKEYINRK